MLLQLSDSQQKAFDALRDPTLWLQNKVLIVGHAGTGKTALAGQLVDEWFNRGYDVVASAPTHQAKTIIGEKLGRDTLSRLTTVASLLGRFKIGKYDKVGFAAPTPAITGRKTIILVDEVSMLGARDVEALLDSASKVIFLGDPAQLPPVKQKKSSVWSLEWRFTLVEQMRNRGSIEYLANLNRDTTYWPQFSCSDGSVEVVENWELFDKYIAQLKQAPESTLWLTYTNEGAVSIANKARKALGYGPEPFAIGERLRLHSTCAAGYNGQIVTVLGIRHTDSTKIWGIQLKGEAGLVWVDVLDPLWTEWKQEYVASLIIRLEGGDESVVKELNYFYEGLVDVRYPYSSTIHKAQGLSIPHVFIDSDSMRGRALNYVAISRASTKLTMSRRSTKVTPPCNKAEFAAAVANLTPRALRRLCYINRQKVNSWQGRQDAIEFIKLNPHLSTSDAVFAEYKRLYGTTKHIKRK